MSKNTLYIFSAEWCVNCKPLKDNLTRLDIPFEEVDVESDEGSMKAAMHGVRSLPTALVEGPDGETIFLQAGTGALTGIREIMQAQ